ncbi:MAG: hypothetical protein ACN4GZ_02005 [Acidimicrobiales bacterium]
MGEPVTVVQSATAIPSRIRFETNRSFTGMGHERYAKGETIVGDRPPDVLAGALLATGKVDDVHVYAQTITVTLAAGQNPAGLKSIIEDLYTYYKPGVPVPSEADFN